MASLVTVSIPQDYGYVLLTATSTFAVSIWHAMRIGKFRKAAGVPYPYAFFFPQPSEYSAYLNDPDHKSTVDDPKRKELYLFNCAQRAHANYNEYHPSFLGSLLIAGLGYPKTAAALGVAWTISRIAYAVGYTRTDRIRGKGRMAGSGFWLAQFALIGYAAKVGIDFILGGVRA